MNSIKDQIRSLQAISEALEPSEKQRNTYVAEVQAYANQFINELPDQKAYTSDHETKGSLGLSKRPKQLSELLQLYQKEVATKGITAASGGHLGYIPGGGIYTSALADYIADITNEYTGMYYASPGGVTIENELIDWMKGLFGFPTSAIGNLTSGGSIANLIALTAARDKYKVKGAAIEQSVIYVSEQVHHCIHKALRIIGLEDVIIRHIALDDRSRIHPAALNEAIKKDLTAHLNPFLVIASAGTTDTGAIDPLDTIATLAEDHQLWFHVDGAYGGFFMLTDEKKDAFKGIERADSLVIDPHKGLFLPYGLGAVLVKDQQAVFKSHHYTANYMQDALQDDFPVNPADVSPELTKHFRGLRLWLPLQLHGIEPFKACLQEKLLLTQYFREQLIVRGFEVGPEPELSVSYFWRAGKDLASENTFNQALMKEIHHSGEVFLSSTNIRGRFVIRIAILSFRTKLETIEKALQMIDTALQNVSKNNDFLQKS